MKLSQVRITAIGNRWFTTTAMVALVFFVSACQRDTPSKQLESSNSPSVTQEKKTKDKDVSKVDSGHTKTKSDTKIDVPTTTSTVSKVSSNSSEKGKQLFSRHCAACHGDKGNGQGIAAKFLFPKPRDIQAGRFRLVSTSNYVPSRDDLHSVLLRGMPGSSMPPWRHLSQADRDMLVDEIMRLRRVGAREIYIALLKKEEDYTDDEIADEEVQEEIKEYVNDFSIPGESSVVPEISEPTEESIARGKKVYVTIGCVSCHGKEGKGDGTAKMVDAENLPTRPRDFTLGIFKGGHDPASLYRRTAYGMPGTPMPSSPKLTSEQMVDLIHYIRSMSTEKQRQAAILNRDTIVAKLVETIPANAQENSWTSAKSVKLRMMPLWWRDDSDRDLTVQAVHDGKQIAVRVSWRDKIKDQHAARSESFEDALAMELYRGDSEPFIGMSGPKTPIDIWFWDADRQGPQVTVDDLYPNAVVDRFPFSESVVKSAELNRVGAHTSDQPDISLPARAVGNPIVPKGDVSGASSLTTAGPGSVTFRIPKSQLVTARGEWSDGRWTVVMTRSLTVDTKTTGITLSTDGKTSVAFAVWDGSQQDRDGKKLITIWQDLVLEKK